MSSVKTKCDVYNLAIKDNYGRILEEERLRLHLVCEYIRGKNVCKVIVKVKSQDLLLRQATAQREVQSLWRFIQYNEVCWMKLTEKT